MQKITASSIGKAAGAEMFHVEVRDGESCSEHEVTLHDAYLAKLTDGRITGTGLVRRSFEFLLDREPKESILRSFDLSLISKYFPEYERVMKEMI
jgi:hypothetical protein